MASTQPPINLAVLIDADNTPVDRVAHIITEASKKGTTTVRRAYGNWSSPQLRPWVEPIREFAIQPIQQFDYIKGKNATDIALVISAMDLLYSERVQAFAIASSDCDFTPLAIRIRENGLKVYGFGRHTSASAFKAACTQFFEISQLGVKEDSPKVQKSPEVSEEPTKAKTAKGGSQKQVAQSRPSAKELKQDTALMNLLCQSIQSTQSKEGWSSISAIGIFLSKNNSFNLKTYKYAKLTDLFSAIDLFEVDRKGKTIRVRQKPKK